MEVVDPNCPTLECEHDTWCRNLDGSTMKKTYFYLDDGTKCPACRRCIGKRNVSMFAFCGSANKALLNRFHISQISHHVKNWYKSANFEK